MFSKSIVLSDAFLDMPMSARCLYFTLNMFADDDGFVGSPKGIMRQCGASQDDMKILLAKRFILDFDSGVIVIKHWRINNYLRNDRYKETTYLEEKETLTIDQKGAYTEKDKGGGIPSGIPSGIPMVDQCETQYRLGKDSIGKDNTSRGFKVPTLEEVQEYCKSRGNNIDPEMFIAHYESNGWMVGKNKMKSWKSAIITWEKRREEKPKTTQFNNFHQRENDWASLEKELLKR